MRSTQAEAGVIAVHDPIIDDEADNPRELACTPRERGVLPGRRRLTGGTRALESMDLSSLGGTVRSVDRLSDITGDVTNSEHVGRRSGSSR